MLPGSGIGMAAIIPALASAGRNYGDIGDNQNDQDNNEKDEENITTKEKVFLEGVRFISSLVPSLSFNPIFAPLLYFLSDKFMNKTKRSLATYALIGGIFATINYGVFCAWDNINRHTDLYKIKKQDISFEIEVKREEYKGSLLDILKDSFITFPSMASFVNRSKIKEIVVKYPVNDGKYGGECKITIIPKEKITYKDELTFYNSETHYSKECFKDEKKLEKMDKFLYNNLLYPDGISLKSKINYNF